MGDNLILEIAKKFSEISRLDKVYIIIILISLLAIIGFSANIIIVVISKNNEKKAKILGLKTEKTIAIITYCYKVLTLLFLDLNYKNIEKEIQILRKNIELHRLYLDNNAHRIFIDTIDYLIKASFDKNNQDKKYEISALKKIRKLYGAIK